MTDSIAPTNSETIVENNPISHSYSTTEPISNNPCSSHTTSDILRLMDSLYLPIPPDIYASLIKECTTTCHSHIKKSRIKLSLPLLNRLLLMHVSCGHLEIAHQLFDQMFLRDFNSWAIMIVACLHAGDSEPAIAYFVLMERRNFMFKFPAWIIVCLFKSCFLAKNMELGKQVHGKLLKLGVSNDLSLSGSLINCYGNFRCLDDANFVFNQLARRNTVTWTAEIVNGCREDQFSKAIDDFIEMGKQGIKKNSFTFSSVLEAFEIVGDERNIACWNAMLMGYVHNKFCIQAIKLLYQMKEAGIKVQESLINDVRIACASRKLEIWPDIAESRTCKLYILIIAIL